MAIILGENSWILISLIFLELLLIIIPVLIAAKIESKSFKEELILIGFRRNRDRFTKNFIKILAGLAFGVSFFLIGGYILFFFRNIIVENMFGTNFIRQGKEGSIRTDPIKPSLIQLIILILLQIFIIGPCEEGFFRGFIIKKCENKVKCVYAIIFSSICFSIYHVPPFLVPITTLIVFFGYYFIFGILLSIIFKIFNDSLIPSSVAHSLFNILIIISIYVF